MCSTSDLLSSLAHPLPGAINQHRNAQQRHRTFPRSAQAPSSTHDVVIDGVTFESSSRSLVRKSRESLQLFCSQNGTQPISYSSQTPLSIRQSAPQADIPANRFFKETTWAPSLSPSGLQTKGIFSHPSTPTKELQHDPRQYSSANTVCPLPQFPRRLRSDCPL